MAPRPLPQSWPSPSPTIAHYNSTLQWHPAMAAWWKVQSAKVVRPPPPLLEVRTPIAKAIWGIKLWCFRPVSKSSVRRKKMLYYKNNFERTSRQSHFLSNKSLYMVFQMRWNLHKMATKAQSTRGLSGPTSLTGRWSKRSIRWRLFFLGPWLEGSSAIWRLERSAQGKLRQSAGSKLGRQQGLGGRVSMVGTS